VPEYDFRRVRDGWKTVTYDIPKYEEKQFKVGTKTVYDYEPEYKWKKVQTGWRDNPAYRTSSSSSSSGKGPGLNSILPPEKRNGGGGDDPDPEPDYSYEQQLFQNRQANYLAQREQQADDPEPEADYSYEQQLFKNRQANYLAQREQQADDPEPEADYSYETELFRNRQENYQHPSRSERDDLPEWLVHLGANSLDEGAKFGLDFLQDYRHWTMGFNLLDEGPMAGKLSIPGTLDDGGREFYGLFGSGAHNADTVTDAIDDALLDDALKLVDDGDGFLKKFGGPAITLGISGFLNFNEAFSNENLDQEDKWQEALVGTGVDVGLDFVSGGLAALIVGIAIPVLGAGIIASAPAWAPVAATAVVAAGIGIFLDQVGVNTWIKEHVNNIVDEAEDGWTNYHEMKYNHNPFRMYIEQDE